MKTGHTKILNLGALVLGIALSGCGQGGTPHGSASTQAKYIGDGSPSHILAISEEYSMSIGVDLRDVVTYKAVLGIEAGTLVSAMTSTPESFFPAGVRFLAAGPTLPQATQRNSVYGVEFEDFEVEPDNTKYAVVNALFHSDAGGFAFRTFDVTFSAEGTQILKVDIVRELPLNQTHFEAHIGLMQRKLILEDTTNNIRKIYAIGIGGFDPGVANSGGMTALTPKIKMAVLEKSAAMFSRTYPSYYAGRPFIRISSGVGGYTAFGLHYSITDQLVRGFVSHGCIRMRDKDLYELYYILTTGGDATVSLEMRYWLKDLADTPYPLDNSDYERVKNFGSDENPETRRDKDNLVVMEDHKGPPPEDNFVDNLAHLMNLQ